MSYDPECEVLARHFLLGEPDGNERTIKRLAQEIQDDVEERLMVLGEEYLEDERAQRENRRER